ncbi:TonB-dependent siderophore receptor [Pectobacterium cacticida]|uniref:TonB-dependent siderophore receptor n=1 Tax=Pectobacterium cacticida TaxID=69221 RepID=UPI002FEE7821
MKHNVKIKRLALIIASTLFLSPPFLSAATGNVTNSQSDSIADYQIPAGNLSLALVQFSLQSNMQLIAPSSLTDGLATPGVSGKLSASDALEKLLAGSGLHFILDSQQNIVTLSGPQSNGDNPNQLNAVKVEGVQSAIVAGGANGSTDLTATEGSNSYTTTAISIGSKTPQSLKETPQSVSVITNKQIKDQNLTSLDSVMSKASGITVRKISGSDQYYSRGWRVTNIQLDGGTPIQLFNSLTSSDSAISSFDMSMFDHAEILRGGDSLNSVGSSSPGGSINLTRKRPLDHKQVSISGQAGSWNDYRTSVDVSSPLAFDDKLRGRTVITWQDKDQFYHPANERSRLLYGILEADLTPTTLFSVGGSYVRKNSLPWESGLPRYQSGRDANYPRSTSLTLPWGHEQLISKELFTQLKQTLGEHWTLNAQLTYLDQSNIYREGSIIGAVPDLMPDWRYSDNSAGNSDSKQYLSDINLVGKFDVFSLPQQVSFSGSYQKNKSDIVSFYNVTGTGLLTDPEPNWDIQSLNTVGYNTSNLVAKVDSVLLPFLPDLHFQTALRWDRYDANYNAFIPSLDMNLGVNVKTERTSVPYYALRYDISPDWSVYGSYTDLYQFQAQMRTVDNNPLPPMTGSTREIGIKYSQGSTNASLSAYRSMQRNGAVTDLLNPDYYRIGSQEEISEGIDFEITGEPLPWWSVNFGYTFNSNKSKPDFEDTSNDRTLSSFTPKHMFKLWNDFQLSGNEYLNKTRVGLGVIAQTRNYTSGQVCSKVNADATCDFENYVTYAFGQGFYSVVSTRLSYQITDNWSAALNVNNLFDRHYYSSTSGVDSGNWYGAPRNVVFTIDGTF